MLSHSALLELLYDLFAMLMFISYLALMVVIVVRVVMTRRAIGVSLSWLILIFTIPFLGVSLYLLFGEVRLGRKRVERARAMYEPYARWIHQLSVSFLSRRLRAVRRLNHSWSWWRRVWVRRCSVAIRWPC